MTTIFANTKVKYNNALNDASPHQKLFMTIWLITTGVFAVLFIGGLWVLFMFWGTSVSLTTPTTVYKEGKTGLMFGAVLFMLWILVSLIGWKVFKVIKGKTKGSNEKNI